MQINISEAMRQVLLGAVRYAISGNADIWSEAGYDDGEGVDLEDARAFLENEPAETGQPTELKMQVEVNRRLAGELIDCRLELAKINQGRAV